MNALEQFLHQERTDFPAVPLDRVRAKDDREIWLDFFLTGVRDTAEQAVATARRLLSVLEEHRRKIQALGGPAVVRDGLPRCRIPAPPDLAAVGAQRVAARHIRAQRRQTPAGSASSCRGAVRFPRRRTRRCAPTPQCDI